MFKILYIKYKLKFLYICSKTPYMTFKELAAIDRKKGRIFMDKEHHLYLKPGRGHYTSVTQVIDKYKQPYNAEYWAIYKAFQRCIIDYLIDTGVLLSDSSDSLKEKHSKDLLRNTINDYCLNNHLALKAEDLVVLNKIMAETSIPLDNFDTHLNDILKEWMNEGKKANVKGNAYHRSREIDAVNNAYEVNTYDGAKYPVHNKYLLLSFLSEEELNHPDFLDKLDSYEDWQIKQAVTQKLDFAPFKYSPILNLYDLPDGFYPELILYNDEYKIAGTADRVFIETIHGERFVDIDDYKTNKAIPQKSFWDRNTRSYKMMLDPLDHLMDCKHVHYNLQVSIYAFFLEQMGFTVRDLAYHHFNAKISLDYLRDEAILLLEDFTYGKKNKGTKNDPISINLKNDIDLTKI